MTSINTNMVLLNAARQNRLNEKSLDNNMEHISSGQRVNHAQDNASAYSMATRLTANITTNDVALKNISDGNALLQTRDHALFQIAETVVRIKECAMRGANGGADYGDHKVLSSQINQLKNYIDEIISRASFNGQDAFVSGADDSINIRFGSAQTNQALTIDLEDISSYMDFTVTPSTTAVIGLIDPSDLNSVVAQLDGLFGASGTLITERNNLRLADANPMTTDILEYSETAAPLSVRLSAYNSIKNALQDILDAKTAFQTLSAADSVLDTLVGPSGFLSGEIGILGSLDGNQVSEGIQYSNSILNTALNARYNRYVSLQTKVSELKNAQKDYLTNKLESDVNGLVQTGLGLTQGSLLSEKAILQVIDTSYAEALSEDLTTLQAQLDTLIGVNGTSGFLGSLKTEALNIPSQYTDSNLNQLINERYSKFSALKTAVDDIKTYSSPINQLKTISDTVSGLIGTNGVGGALRSDLTKIESLAQPTVPISNTTLNTAIADRRAVLTQLKTYIGDLKTAASNNAPAFSDSAAFSDALDIYVDYYLDHNDLSAIVNNNGFELVSAFNQYHPNLNFYDGYGDLTELQYDLLVQLATNILTIDTYMNQIDAAIDQIDSLPSPAQTNNQLNYLSYTLKSNLEARRNLLNDLNGYVSALQAMSELDKAPEDLLNYLQANNTALTQYLALGANPTGGNILDDDGAIVIAYDQNLYNLLEDWHENYQIGEDARTAIRGIENIPLQIVGWQEGYRLVRASLREVNTALEHQWSNGHATNQTTNTELQTRSSAYSALIQDLNNLQGAIAANNTADINAAVTSYNSHIAGVNFSSATYASRTAEGSAVTLSAFAPTSLSLTGLNGTTISDLKTAVGALLIAQSELDVGDYETITDGDSTLLTALSQETKSQFEYVLLLNNAENQSWNLSDGFAYPSSLAELITDISSAVDGVISTLIALDSNSATDNIDYVNMSLNSTLSNLRSRSTFYNSLVSKAQDVRTAVNNLSGSGSLSAVENALAAYSSALGATIYSADSVNVNGTTYSVAAFNAAGYEMNVNGVQYSYSPVSSRLADYNSLIGFAQGISSAIDDYRSGAVSYQDIIDALDAYNQKASDIRDQGYGAETIGQTSIVAFSPDDLSRAGSTQDLAALKTSILAYELQRDVLTLEDKNSLVDPDQASVTLSNAFTTDLSRSFTPSDITTWNPADALTNISGWDIDSILDDVDSMVTQMDALDSTRGQGAEIYYKNESLNAMLNDRWMSYVDLTEAANNLQDKIRAYRFNDAATKSQLESALSSYNTLLAAISYESMSLGGLNLKGFSSGEAISADDTDTYAISLSNADIQNGDTKDTFKSRIQAYNALNANYGPILDNDGQNLINPYTFESLTTPADGWSRSVALTYAANLNIESLLSNTGTLQSAIDALVTAIDQNTSTNLTPRLAHYNELIALGVDLKDAMGDYSIYNPSSIKNLKDALAAYNNKAAQIRLAAYTSQTLKNASDLSDISLASFAPADISLPNMVGDLDFEAIFAAADIALQQINLAQSQVGISLNVLDSITREIEEQTLIHIRARSGLMDTDFAEEMAELSQNSALRIAIQSMMGDAKDISRSLVDALTR